MCIKLTAKAPNVHAQYNPARNMVIKFISPRALLSEQPCIQFSIALMEFTQEKFHRCFEHTTESIS